MPLTIERCFIFFNQFADRLGSKRVSVNEEHDTSNADSTMSEQGNFVGGFLLGTLVGGALGGVVGALAASRNQAGSYRLGRSEGDDLSLADLDDATEETMEAARLGLEAKIAQINDAIDDVRQQLGHINGQADKTWGNPSRVD
jgi:hypothetical protein